MTHVDAVNLVIALGRDKFSKVYTDETEWVKFQNDYARVGYHESFGYIFVTDTD